LGNNLSRTDTFIFLISVIFVKSLPIDRECFNAIKQHLEDRKQGWWRRGSHATSAPPPTPRLGVKRYT